MITEHCKVEKLLKVHNIKILFSSSEIGQLRKLLTMAGH